VGAKTLEDKQYPIPLDQFTSLFYAASVLPIKPYEEAGPLWGLMLPTLISALPALVSDLFWAAGFAKMATPSTAIIRKCRHGGVASRDTVKQDRPREEWVEMPVPAIVTGTSRWGKNAFMGTKSMRPVAQLRRALVQGLVACPKSGYALHRTSTPTSARKTYHFLVIRHSIPVGHT